MEAKERYFYLEVSLTFFLLALAISAFREVFQQKAYLIAGLLCIFSLSRFFSLKKNRVLDFLISAGTFATILWTVYSMLNSSFFYEEVMLICVKGVLILEFILSFGAWKYATLSYIQALSVILFMSHAVFLKGSYDTPSFVIAAAYLIDWFIILRLKFCSSFKEPATRSKQYYFSLLAFFVIIALCSKVSFSSFPMGKKEWKGVFQDESFGAEGIFGEKKEGNSKKYYDLQDKIQDGLTRLVPDLNSSEARHEVLFLFSSLIKEASGAIEVDKAETGLVSRLKSLGRELEEKQLQQIPASIKTYVDNKIEYKLKATDAEMMKILKQQPLNIKDRFSVLSGINRMLKADSFQKVKDGKRMLQKNIRDSSFEAGEKSRLEGLAGNLKEWKMFQIYRKTFGDYEKQSSSSEGQLGRKELAELISEIKQAQDTAVFRRTDERLKDLRESGRFEQQEVLEKAQDLLGLKLEMFLDARHAGLKEKLGEFELPEEAQKRLEEVSSDLRRAENYERFLKEALEFKQETEGENIDVSEEVADLLDMKAYSLEEAKKEEISEMLGDGVLSEMQREAFSGRIQEMNSELALEDLDSDAGELKTDIEQFFKQGSISRETKDGLARGIEELKNILSYQLELREGDSTKYQGQNSFAQNWKDMVEKASLGKDAKDALKRMADELSVVTSSAELKDIQQAVAKELEAQAKKKSEEKSKKTSGKKLAKAKTAKGGSSGSKGTTAGTGSGKKTGSAGTTGGSAGTGASGGAAGSSGATAGAGTGTAGASGSSAGTAGTSGTAGQTGTGGEGGSGYSQSSGTGAGGTGGATPGTGMSGGQGSSGTPQTSGDSGYSGTKGAPGTSGTSGGEGVGVVSGGSGYSGPSGGEGIVGPFEGGGTGDQGRSGGTTGSGAAGGEGGDENDTQIAEAPIEVEELAQTAATEQSPAGQSTTEQSPTEQSPTASEQSAAEQSTTEQEQSSIEQSAVEQSGTSQSTAEQSATQESASQQTKKETEALKEAFNPVVENRKTSMMEEALSDLKQDLEELGKYESQEATALNESLADLKVDSSEEELINKLDRLYKEVVLRETKLQEKKLQKKESVNRKNLINSLKANIEKAKSKLSLGQKKKLISIKIEPEGLSIPLGEKGHIRAKGFYSDGKEKNLTSFVEWVIQDKKIAGIYKGTVYPRSPGKIKVFARLREAESVPVSLVVNEPKLLSILIWPQELNISMKDKLEFKAEGYFSDGSNRDITALVSWNIAGANVIRLKDSFARPLKIGETHVFAQYLDIKSLPARISVILTLEWLWEIIFEWTALFMLSLIAIFSILYLITKRKARKLLSLSDDSRSLTIGLYENAKKILSIFGLKHEGFLSTRSYAELVEKKRGARDKQFLDFTEKYEEANYSKHFLPPENSILALNDYNRFLKSLMGKYGKFILFIKYCFVLLHRRPLFIKHNAAKKISKKTLDKEK